MNKLKKLGFKKVPGTEPGFHMYELTPARLPAACPKPQAPSTRLQASSAKLAIEETQSETIKNLESIINEIK